jgi:hypothetical protein
MKPDNTAKLGGPMSTFKSVRTNKHRVSITSTLQGNSFSFYNVMKKANIIFVVQSRAKRTTPRWSGKFLSQ